MRRLGLREYDPVFRAMRDFTGQRDAQAPDEVWLLEHTPVFTLGRAALSGHVLDPGGIPVIRTDRGGQVTYHGPGQLVAYLLIDLQRRGLGIRPFVRLLEEAVIDLLARYGIPGSTRPGAPGVYVGGKKIASLGLRIRRGCSYHGLSLNVAMDLGPFRRIHPCGFPDLEVTQLSELTDATDTREVAETLLRVLTPRLGYDTIRFIDATIATIPATSGTEHHTSLDPDDR